MAQPARGAGNLDRYSVERREHPSQSGSMNGKQVFVANSETYPNAPARDLPGHRPSPAQAHHHHHVQIIATSNLAGNNTYHHTEGRDFSGSRQVPGAPVTMIVPNPYAPQPKPVEIRQVPGSSTFVATPVSPQVQTDVRQIPGTNGVVVNRSFKQ